MNKIINWFISLIKAILSIILFIAAIFIFFTLYISSIYLCITNILCTLALFILIIGCITYCIHDMYYTENYFEKPLSETDIYIPTITYAPIVYNELNITKNIVENIVENINETGHINIKLLFENTNFKK